MKILIIAAPSEADAIRRAAITSGCEAVAVEAGDSLPGWLAASRPDVVVVGTEPLPPVIERVRRGPGGNVPLLALCDVRDEVAARKLADAILHRPAAPERIVKQAKELCEARRPETTGEFPAAGSGPRTPPLPGTRVVLSSTAGPPTLRPLTMEAAGDGTKVASRPTVVAPFIRKLATSIEEALDDEMASTLKTVDGVGPGRGTSPAYTEGTRAVPRELLQGLLFGGAAAPRGASPEKPATSDSGSQGELAGDLSGTSLPALLGRALMEGLTGRLRFRRGEVEKSIFFEAGRPVLAVSSAVADRMVQMLVRTGKLGPEDAQRAVAVATQTGRRMGAVLIDLGLLKSSELLPAVRQHYEDIVTSLFVWEDGSFRFEVGAVADPRRVRLLRHPAALVLDGLRRWPAGRLARAAGAMDDVLRLDARASATDILLEIGGGDPQTQRLPVLFDGVRPLSEVLRLAGMPEAAALPVVVTLRAFGLLHVASGTAGRRPVPEVVAARDREIDRQRIRARYALVREGDYFDVLGVPRRATTDDVLLAYGRITRELSDESIGPELAEELASELADVRAVLVEAVRILGDERMRAAYLAHLPDPADTGDGSRGRGVEVA